MKEESRSNSQTSSASAENPTATEESKNRNAANTTTPPLQGALAGSGSGWEEAIYGLLSGALFGLVSPIVGHPFDTVKTQMQAQHTALSTRQVIRTIYHDQGGVAGFYRGLLPPLLGSILYRGILFSAYSGAYAACADPWHEPLPYTFSILRPSVLVGSLAAASARTVIESPLDYIKVRRQLGRPILRPGTDIVSVSAVGQLFQGFTPTFLRTLGLLGSFFVMVDCSVRYIPEIVTAPVYGPFFKGGICATAAWVFAFPFETTKSVVQGDPAKYQNVSTWRVMVEQVRTKGVVGGLYRGFLPGASRSFVANGASMTVYAWFQDAVRSTS